MNCADFDRWLDDGRPEGDGAAARGHARDCRRCAAALDGLLELEAALASAAAAPAGFTDRVMERVAATPQGATRPVPIPAAVLLPPALPWWVRAAMDPAMVLAAALAALLAGWGGPLLDALREWAAHGAGLAAAPHAWAAWAVDPRVMAAAGIALAPSLFWLGRQLYAWSAALVSRREAPAAL